LHTSELLIALQWLIFLAIWAAWSGIVYLGFLFGPSCLIVYTLGRLDPDVYAGAKGNMFKGMVAVSSLVVWIFVVFQTGALTMPHYVYNAGGALFQAVMRAIMP